MAVIPYAALRALRAGTIASPQDRAALKQMAALPYGLINAAQSGAASLYSDDFSSDTLSVYERPPATGTTGAEISGGTLHLIDPSALLSPDLWIPDAAILTVGKVGIDFEGAIDASAFELFGYPAGDTGSLVFQATLVAAGYAGASFPPLALLNISDPSQALQVALPGPMSSGRFVSEVTADHIIVSVLNPDGSTAASVTGDRASQQQIAWHMVMNPLAIADTTAYDNLTVTGTA